MDYDAIDRAMSRAVIRITYHHAPDVRLWVADNPSETATDLPEHAKRLYRLADAWDAIDRLSPEFRGATLDAVSVADLWATRA